MTRLRAARLALCAATLAAVAAFAHPTDFTFYSPLAEAWYQAARTFEWTSTTQNNNGQKVQISYRTFGSRSNPALVMLHGFPTSSFDFREMIEFLEDGYFIATLDSPDLDSRTNPRATTPICWRTMPNSSITT